MKTKMLLLLGCLVAMPAIHIYADDGSKLFTGNCAACHSIGKGKLVGPDLKGVDTRHTEAWILKWVKGSQALVNSGDKDAVKVFADNNQIVMPDQPLSDNDIKSILSYIKAGGDQPVIASTDSNSTTANTATSAAAPPQKTNIEKSDVVLDVVSMFSYTEYLLMFIMALLLMVIYILGITVKSLTQSLKEQKQDSSR